MISEQLYKVGLNKEPYKPTYQPYDVVYVMSGENQSMLQLIKEWYPLVIMFTVLEKSMAPQQDGTFRNVVCVSFMNIERFC